MQVFVPHTTFAESVRVLDNKRLGKQRVETYQIVNVLLGIGPVKGDVDENGTQLFEHREPKGWRRHPAVLAWEKNIGALYVYQVYTCAEWADRGFKDTCLDKTFAAITFALGSQGPMNFDMPSWWGNEDVHSSHRSRLLAKDPEWYGQFGWTDDPTRDYVWPHTLQETT